MSRNPHAPGGILPPLGSLLPQKRVVPVDVCHKGEKEEEPSTSSGSRTSFAKSLHQGEALLRKRTVKHDADCRYRASCLGNGESKEGLFLSQSHLPSSGSQLIQGEQSLSRTWKGFFKPLSTDNVHGEFCYHPAYASIEQHSGRLNGLTQHRHYLRLVKDYTIRLKGAWDFTHKLSGLLVSQQTTAAEQTPFIQTGELKVLCEELRKQTSHWSAIQKKMRRDCLLRPLLLVKHDSLTRMRTNLSRLALQAIEFTDLLINSSLRSLSHEPNTCLSPAELSDFFRGVEIYNQVVLDGAALRELQEVGTSDVEAFLTTPILRDALGGGKTPGRPGPYPIVRVLHIISEERGKLAADRLLQYLLKQDEFSSSVNSIGQDSVDWKKVKVPSFNNLSSVAGAKQHHQNALCRPKMIEFQPASSQLDTSDPLKAICTEDEHLIKNILDVLVSATDTFWHHFIKKPKPEHPNSAQCFSGPQPSCSVNGLLVTNGDLDAIHAEERLDIQGCLGSASQLELPTSEAVEVLHTRYRAMLWKEFAAGLFGLFYTEPTTELDIVSLTQCKEGVRMAVVQSLEEMLTKASVPEECVLEGWNLCLRLLTQTVLVCWDRDFCKALGSGLSDKCVLDESELEGVVRSRTAGWLLELFPPLNFLLECMHLRKNLKFEPDPMLLSFLLAVLSRCLATLQSSCTWVMAKAYHFLSSWSLNQFLLVTQADLMLLICESEKMTALVREACPDEVDPYVTKRSGKSFQVSELCLQIQTAAASIQETHLLNDDAGHFAKAWGQHRSFSEHCRLKYVRRFSSEVLQLFSDDCRRMSTDLFLQTMPTGKHWRLRLRADIPSEPSEYATAAVHAVIGQVLQGIRLLPQDSQISALTQVLVVFMEAWMGYIVQHKIKFSLQGALQLKQDFDMVRDMIQSRDFNLSQEVRQAILSHRVFHRVDNAIICLLQQPTSKTYMPSTGRGFLQNCCTCSCSRSEDFSSGSLNSLESLDVQTARNGAALEAQTSATADLLSKMRSSSNPESYLTVNQQEWLSLRLHSGRHWRVPGLSCFSATPEP